MKAENVLDNDLLLIDRLGVIRDTINKYGEDNFYLSFSGGKDSTVVHHLLDMALPENRIPRVFSNTGIEYKANVDFVKSIKDDRFVIIPPSKNIPQTLKKVGYPFKSKLYSQHYETYRKHKEEIWKEMKKIEEKPSLKQDYDYIHNLPRGIKTAIKYYYNLRERERVIVSSTYFMVFPECLKYQWHEDLNISDKCCTEFKEKPMDEWAKKNGRQRVITGVMAEEGGRRANAKCQGTSHGQPTFNPLAKVSKEWEEWFIKKYNIRLSSLYYEPFNFERTGCRGCPFNINLQEDLNTLERYFPAERKACEIIFKPVYNEYRRIGYRLKKEENLKLF